jgi:hypothetical protein
LCAYLNHALFDVVASLTHALCHRGYQISAVFLLKDLNPQGTGLFKINITCIFVRLSLGKALDRERFSGIFFVSNWATKSVWFIVWLVAKIRSDIHGAISLIVLNLTIQGAVNWNLLEVTAETMAMGVRVGENSGL